MSSTRNHQSASSDQSAKDPANRIVVINQSTYLPWLGYFEQMARADVFIFLDSVQFSRQSWQSRNRIQTFQREKIWLTVPLEKQPLKTAIYDILISTEKADWAESHLKAIEDSFGHAPHFEELRAVIRPILLKPQTHLVDLNIELILALAGKPRPDSVFYA